MAPKAKPDPAIAALVKELRQSAILEERLKQLREMQNRSEEHTSELQSH
jgi:hypothetical protein